MNNNNVWLNNFLSKLVTDGKLNVNAGTQTDYSQIVDGLNGISTALSNISSMAVNEITDGTLEPTSDTPGSLYIERQGDSIVSVWYKINNNWSQVATGGGGGIDYSTEEQDTGLKWIDGKKIYVISKHFINTNGVMTDYSNIGLSTDDVDTVIDQKFTAKRDLGNELLYYSGNGSNRSENNANLYIAIRVYKGDVQYVQKYGTQITNITVTIYYTKNN